MVRQHDNSDWQRLLDPTQVWRNFLETSNSSLFSIQASSNAGSTGDVTGTQNTDTRENSGPNIAAIVGLIGLVLLYVAGLLLGRRQWEIASTSNSDSDLPTDTVLNRRGKEALPDSVENNDRGIQVHAARQRFFRSLFRVPTTKEILLDEPEPDQVEDIAATCTSDPVVSEQKISAEIQVNIPTTSSPSRGGRVQNRPSEKANEDNRLTTGRKEPSDSSGIEQVTFRMGNVEANTYESPGETVT